MSADGDELFFRRAGARAIQPGRETTTMIKTITIVSLSAGTLGKNFVRHELDLGLQRLRDLGLRVKFAAHALAGRAYLAAHPEARAADLLEAFRD